MKLTKFKKVVIAGVGALTLITSASGAYALNCGAACFDWCIRLYPAGDAYTFVCWNACTHDCETSGIG